MRSLPTAIRFWLMQSRKTKDKVKTAELIRRLQEADPSGEMECVVGTSDVYFVEALPYYYDGAPLLLVHDEKLRDNAYSIVGARYMISGNKVRITTMDLEAVLCGDPELPIETGSKYEARVESTRREMREMIACANAETTERERGANK